MKWFGKARIMFVMGITTVILLTFTFLFPREAPLKKINAKLACTCESQDGVQFRYPGNGAKIKPRLDGTINCWIAIQKIPAGVTLKGKLKANGKMQEAEVIPRPDDTYSADASFSPQEGDFETCSSFTVTGELTLAGKTVWKGKLNIDQRCAD
jgi:hypothetical protein